MLVAWRYKLRNNSLIQSFDPRAWVFFYLCFLFASFTFWDARFILPFFILTLFILFTSGVQWDEIRRPMFFILGFAFFLSLLTFITGRGGIEVYKEEHLLREFKASFSLLGWTPSIKITIERIFFAISQFERVGSIAIMTILIPYTLNPAFYGITFKGLGMPDKFAYAMDLTMRFIPTFGRDFQLTMDAQRARGYELEKISGGVIQQVRKLGPIFVPVTIHAIISSEDIIDAMDLRAFGVGPRTWTDVLTYQTRDRFLIVFGILMVAVTITLAAMGYGSFWVPEQLLKGL